MLMLEGSVNAENYKTLITGVIPIVQELSAECSDMLPQYDLAP